MRIREIMGCSSDFSQIRRNVEADVEVLLPRLFGSRLTAVNLVPFVGSFLTAESFKPLVPSTDVGRLCSFLFHQKYHSIFTKVRLGASLKILRTVSRGLYKSYVCNSSA